MDERTRWMSYKGKEILFNDYSGLTEQEILDRIKFNRAFILEQNKKGIFLFVDVSRNTASVKIVSAFKEIAAAIQPLVGKSAVVGLNHIQKVILQGINRVSNLGIVPFESKVEALDWLAAESRP